MATCEVMRLRHCKGTITTFVCRTSYSFTTADLHKHTTACEKPSFDFCEGQWFARFVHDAHRY
jgi:hypothetical protein